MAKAVAWKVTYVDPSWGYDKDESFYEYDTKLEAVKQRRHL